MTTHLYDPLASDYFDAADTRAERDRSFQVCSDCRLCVKFCPSFKDLFRMIDLLALTGAHVSVVERCSAIDGTWGLRAANVEMAHRIAAPLMDTLRADSAELVAGDCHLANTAIREATTKGPVHPVQVLARAYGLEEA